MRRTLSIAIAAITLNGCDAIASLSHEGRAVRACEEALKPSLTSPSSYHRIWSNFMPAAPLTKEDLIDINETSRMEAIKHGDDAGALFAAINNRCLKDPKASKLDCSGMLFEALPHPRTAFILIEYEAANAFNSMLPGYFLCRTSLADGDKYEGASMMLATGITRNEGDRLKSQADLMKQKSN